MSTAKNNDVAKIEQTATPQTSVTYVPDVDILEDSDSIRLVADLPGASQPGVDVTVENGILTIDASASVANPEGYTLVGQEYGVGRYHRDFTLPDSVNTDGIVAKMKNGILEVVIPKREEVKTRKVRIE